MKAYVIGIDSDKKNQEKAVNELNKLGFEGRAFKGVNGRRGGIDVGNHISLASQFKSKYMKDRATHWQLPVGDLRGALGCSLSHKAVWQDMISNDVSVAIVGEADLLPKSHLLPRVKAAMEHVGEWDIVLLGYNIKNYYLKETDLTDVPSGFKKGKIGFCGTHGYMVSKKGAQILLDHFAPVEIQTDAYITMLIYLDKLRAWFDPKKPIRTLLHKSSTQTGNSGRLSFCHGAPFAVSPLYIGFYVAFAILFILVIVFVTLYVLKNRNH